MAKCINCYHLCCFGNPYEDETWCGHPDGNYAEPWDDACGNYLDKGDKDKIEEYEKYTVGGNIAWFAPMG